MTQIKQITIDGGWGQGQGRLVTWLVSGGKILSQDTGGWLRLFLIISLSHSRIFLVLLCHPEQLYHHYMLQNRY